LSVALPSGLIVESANAEAPDPKICSSAVKPEVLVFGISIKTFGVTFAICFLACGAIVARRLRELGKPVDWAYEIVFAALIGALWGRAGTTSSSTTTRASTT